jgi:hypothetical protein
MLVRHVKQGATWHPATDNLAGTHVYGSFPFDPTGESFSLPYSSYLTQSTPMLFRSGMCK